jgi:CubicO group peptidase (beta-lactamase class C family)
MKKTWAIVVVIVAVLAIAVALYIRHSQGTPLFVKLEAGPPQPRVSVGEAGLDPAVIGAAVDYAARHHSSALVVGRGGHIVFEKYWGKTNIDTQVDPGFAPVLLALTAGAALNDRQLVGLDVPASNYIGDAAGKAGDAPLRELLALSREDLSPAQSMDLLALVLEKAGGKAYPQLVVEKLWRPMGGGNLEFRRGSSALRPDGVDAGCCVHARIGDWMRVAEALANDGVFEGDQLAPPGYVSRMLQPVRADSGRGYFTRVGGDFAAHDLAWLEGTRQQRLWIVPSLKLTILRLGDAAEPNWVETMIPDTIVHGTSGWQPRTVGEGIDPNQYAPH